MAKLFVVPHLGEEVSGFGKAFKREVKQLIPDHFVIEFLHDRDRDEQLYILEQAGNNGSSFLLPHDREFILMVLDLEGTGPIIVLSHYENGVGQDVKSLGHDPERVFVIKPRSNGIARLGLLLSS